MREDIRGTWFVVPTPFHQDRTLDVDSQGRVVEAAIAWGADGLTVMGVTSEASALTPSERSAALAAIREAAGGRVPLVVGCSGGSEEVVVDLAEEAAGVGALAAMVPAPPLHRDLDGLPAFFGRVRARSPLPVVVQDEPAATGVTLPVGLLERCVREADARTVKLEDPPTPPKIAALLRALPGLRVFGGLGGASALEELAAGACGTMTGFAFPEVLRAVRRAHEAGDHPGAARLFERYLPLIRLESRVGVGLRKEVLRRRGALASATTRRAAPLPRQAVADLEAVLADLGLEPGPRRMEPGVASEGA